MSARTMKIKGQAHKVEGKAKETVGRVTGNDRLKASGRADVGEGKVQVALGGAGLKVKKLSKAIAGKR